MLLSVSVSAWATYAEIEYIGDESQAEVIDVFQSIGLFSLPTENTTRLYYINNPVTFGTLEAQSLAPTGSFTIDLNNTNNPNVYKLAQHANSIANVYGFVNVPSGTYYDFSVPVSYSAEEYGSLTVGGNVSSYFYTTSANNGRAFAQSVQLLVNGEPVGDVFAHGSTGATLDVEYEITEDITYLGYRFTFNQAISATTTNTSYPSYVNLFLYVGDDGLFEFASPPQEDPNTGLLQSIVQWIIGIYNSVFVPDSQKDDADNFQSEVSDTVAGADEVKDELDQLEKPNPEDIDTDLSDIITDDSYTQQTQIFADLLRFDKITDMLMIVFTMALISYVLFGKKG